MRKHKRLISLLLASQLLVWFVGSAQTNPFENLPDGFPIGDVSYVGDNSYTSPTFGDFQLDPAVHNRVIHGVLGPLVWEWNETTKVVTLHSEWWGPLYTCLKGDEGTSGLGFSFPYVKSGFNGITYLVDPTGSTSTPFYNHNKDANNNEIGWQSAIGLNLNDARSNYLSAETMVIQMQEQSEQMRIARDKLTGYTVKLGDSGFEQYRQLAAQHFEVVNNLYGRFLFYRLRTILAPQWVQIMGGEEADVLTAQGWVGHIPGLEKTALAVFESAKHTLFNEVESIYGTKLQQMAALQAEEANKNKPTNPSNPTNPGTPTKPTDPGPGSTTPGGKDWESATVVGPCALDVFSWPIGINLQSVSIANNRIYFPVTKKTPWEQVDIGNGLSAGNAWVIQNVGGQYYASTFDYFRLNQYYKGYPAVMTDHLPHIPYMSYRKGQTYGLMVTTLARNKNERHVKLDERSNIILFTME